MGDHRRIRCALVNDSHHSLVLRHEELAAGNCPTRVPDRAPLGTSDRFWICESDDPADAVEGRATFDVGDTGKTLELHWASAPFGGNTFEQRSNLDDYQP